ncbi:hypothetical protein JCM19232_5994 [Vibrio ishigakensis]|uniref:Uncharacterized protein n=1 Tax=Vibrio ishigakensis TaxID=1481914 RepID=A0A0B8PEY5_9VIBR|nr:hypothetical protein JCM19232_5994 [Vibrio ishigakensis]
MSDSDHSPVDKQLLNKVLQAYVNSRKPFYLRWFESQFNAVIFSTGLLVLLAILYIFLHCSNCTVCATKCSDDQYQNSLSENISLDTQTLEISYFEPNILRIMSVEKLKQIRKALDKKFEFQRDGLLDSRVIVAKEANVVLFERLNQEAFPNYTVLFNLVIDRDSARTNYPLDALSLLKSNLENLKASMSDKPAQGYPAAQQELIRITNLISNQEEREKKYKTNVDNYIESLKPMLSYAWLVRQDWKVQLIFWTWFGVLINNIVWLIRSVKNQSEAKDLEYSAQTYIMVIPRLVIAPFISLIFLALISSGIASFDITNLDSLPAFLIAAFFLGFMSESVTLRLRQFFNNLLDSIKTQRQTPFSEAVVQPEPAFVPLQNINLANLEANMRGITNKKTSVNAIKNKMHGSKLEG